MTQPRIVAPRLPTPARHAGRRRSVAPAGRRRRRAGEAGLVVQRRQRVHVVVRDGDGHRRLSGHVGRHRADGRISSSTSSMVTLTLVIFLALRFAPIPPRRKVDAGLALMLLNVLGATSLETWVTGLQLNTLGGPSWAAIIILASAMIMPHTPAQDARRVAGGGGDRSALRLDCVPARHGRAVPDDHLPDVPAELHLGRAWRRCRRRCSSAWAAAFAKRASWAVTS